ncbi:hypothetical protein Cme02nite_44030 [Catellatospora methionotrophica]|uniref:Uncharacterized protein n=1 Tax=Catellatospora methionotrophica TaxID=121620 RepID=A0A8J3LJ22_9ACTN|nr:hypothetical protein Cme02nite_44030 [Catellatospora methionotrophica]
MRRSSRATAVAGTVDVALPGRRGMGGEKSLSRPPAPASRPAEQRVSSPASGPAPRSTDSPRSRSCATPGKDCQ